MLERERSPAARFFDQLQWDRGWALIATMPLILAIGSRKNLIMGCYARRVDRNVVTAMWQSHRNAEFYVGEARKQVSQSDINQSLIMAIEELAREVKRMQDEIHRLRNNTRRRFD